MLPNHVNTRVSPCRATVMVPSGQRPPLSTRPLVMISIKKTYDFDDPTRVSFPVQSRSGCFVSAPLALTASSNLEGA